MTAYNNSAKAYDKKFSDYSVYLEMIGGFADRLSSGSRILDLGCGSGINAARMEKNGHSIVGMDSSESMLALARQRCPEQSFIHGSVNDLEGFKFDPFDALCLSFIIVHLRKEECSSLLKNLKTLIRDDGLLYLSFMPEGPGKIPGYETTSFSEDKIYFHYHNSRWIINLLASEGFRLDSSTIKEYKEKDGSLSEDLFLIFRFKQGPWTEGD